MLAMHDLYLLLDVHTQIATLCEQCVIQKQCTVDEDICIPYNNDEPIELQMN